MRPIREIILHCAATPEGRDIKTATIRDWHVNGNKWSDIGYHYVIELDGSVHEGRPVARVGAHCSGRNNGSIGVCYVGGLDAAGKKAKDTRTPAQKNAMRNLVIELMRRYNLTEKDVHCHNEFAAKACPSFKRDTFIKELHEHD